jgi:hypothetical protein
MGGKIKASGVGMVVREHIDIGPAFGAGGDKVGLAVLTGLCSATKAATLIAPTRFGSGPSPE